MPGDQRRRRRLARWGSIVGEVAEILRPPPARFPDEWADASRVLPPWAAEPGPFRASRAPYTIEPQRAMIDPSVQGAVVIMSAQSGKTDLTLNVLGHRADDDPTPILYVGPSRDFVEDEFFPRLEALLQSTPTLWAKVSKGKRIKKTRVLISGTEVRMAWAGSAKRLAGFGAGLAIFDERDQAQADVAKQGDPFEMVRARGKTYPGFKWLVTSTITSGAVDTFVHEETGFEHWEVADPRDLQSATWRIWQEGTRHERALPCLGCGLYFVPRFKLLRWPKGATPDEAARSAWVECPRCETHHTDRERSTMIERSRYVSPGQSVDRDGTVRGEGVRSSIASFWCSGLATTWNSFGGLARDWLLAARSGDVQGVLNLGFAELYRVAGEAPKWEVVANLRGAYDSDELPDSVRVITAGVDVQKRGIYFVVRGWGYRLESWLLRHGFLEGETDLDQVWDDLEVLLTATTWGDRRLPIRQMLVDSGYRPGDKWRRPEHRIYSWCRKFPGLARPSKGQETLDQPVKLSQLDVTVGNRKIKRAVDLVHIDTSWAKDWIHGRIAAAEGSTGTWHLPSDATDAYCAQVVAESRITTAAGRSKWIQTRKDNHYLDAEVGALGAAYLLGVHLMRDEKSKSSSPPEKRGARSLPVLGRARL